MADLRVAVAVPAVDFQVCPPLLAKSLLSHAGVLGLRAVAPDGALLPAHEGYIAELGVGGAVGGAAPDVEVAVSHWVAGRVCRGGGVGQASYGGKVGWRRDGIG